MIIVVLTYHAMLLSSEELECIGIVGGGVLRGRRRIGYISSDKIMKLCIIFQ
jgi:hypothetical protein